MSTKFAKLAVMACAIASAAAFSARAEPKVDATFGNTVESVYPDGRSQKIWMHPDGTWTGQSRRGNPLAGKWSTKGEKVCLKQTSPPMFGFSFCQQFPDNPETGVLTKDLGGTPIHLKIVKGMVDKQG
jgi:hypothetical protein